MALLTVSSIETLYFDRIYALFGVSLEVREGEIFTVLGPNGAGKTTLLRTIAGLLKDQPKKGEIRFDGRRIDGWQPEAIARLGVVYVPEDRGLFKELTVAENLELGLWGRRDDGVKRDLEAVYGMFPILKDRGRQEAETLSGGEQQMLALGRAMLRRPRLLMLDEPSLGLAPQMVDQIGRVVRTINEQGTAVMLVEQNAAMALRVASHAVVLTVGEVSLRGTADDLAADERIRELYLGGAGERALVGSGAGARAGHRRLGRWVG
jgi:branched-chain amino acid transport system ATP-binding protein